MKAELSITNIYWNKGLSDFFFGSQAMSKLEQLVARSTMGGDETLQVIDEQLEGVDVDVVADAFMCESVEAIAEELGIELK